MSRRIISLSVKLTATTVLLVLIVTAVLAVLTLQTFSDDVEAQTDRLVKIRTEALDRVGSSTARYLALPAANPMYDNDIGALYGLVRPVVAEDSDSDVVYGYIVDDDGRVWMGALDESYESLFVPEATDGDAPFIESTGDPRDPKLPAEVPDTFLQRYDAEVEEFPIREDLERRLVSEDGSTVTKSLQQYTARIVDRNGREVGYLTLAYSLDALEAEVDEIRSAGEARQDDLRRRILMLGGLAAVLGSIIAILQALAITRNVKKLSRAANRIARGDLTVRADVRSRDEIGALGQQFNVMADRVQALLVETEAKASLERELDIARMIQERLVPAPGLTERGGVRFAGYFQSASICGGDFWHYNVLAHDELLLTIGDVTGHGVPSAMISAAAKSGLDTLINVSKADITLHELLGELNKTIYDTARRKFVMTFLAAKIDRQRGRLSFANAGHNFPLLVRPGSDGSAPEIRPLVVRGNRLGDDRTSVFEAREVEVMAGDLLLLYTDGLTEYADAAGREYGERRLRRLMPKLVGLEPDAVLERLLESLRAFAGDAPQEDDITIVVARI